VNEDLAEVMALGKVLESASEGRGMSRALVEEFARGKGTLRDAAKMLLLGHPIPESLRASAEEGSAEVSMLASLIRSTPGSSTTLVGANGRAMARTLERWVNLRETARMEQRVHSFRSLITSGVLGAVTAMVATLGPLVGNLNLVSAPSSYPQYLLMAAGVMTAVSASILGYFMSGRRFVLNVAVAMTVFVIVETLASPLASFSSPGLWGVK
jgi:hypothetical protein